MHMWSLLEETNVISLELDRVPCGHLRLKSTGSSQGKKKKKNPLNNPQRGKSYLDLQQCFVIIAHHQDTNKRTKTYRAKEQKRALIRNFISQYYLGPEVCFALSMQEQWEDSSTPVKPENPKIPFVSTGEEQKSLVPRPRGWLQGPVTRCIGDPHSKGSSNGI